MFDLEGLLTFSVGSPLRPAAVATSYWCPLTSPSADKSPRVVLNAYMTSSNSELCIWVDQEIWKEFREEP